MKIFRLGFAVLLIAGIAQAAEIFEIISYFPDKGTVRVNQGAGQTNRPFSSFTSEEQKQITDWLTDQEFENSGLSVTIEKKTETKKVVNKSTSMGRQGETDYIIYAITLENRAKVALQNVGINYRIFYETQDGSEKAKRSSIKIDRIDLRPGELRTIETQAVAIRDERAISSSVGHTTVTGFSPSSGFSTSTSGGAPTIYYKDRLMGVYLCVSKTDRNGKTIEHEFEQGNIPGKEKWVDYGSQPQSSQRQSPATASSAISKAAVSGAKKSTGEWSEEEIEKWTKTAERNSIGAVFLAEYYSRQGDAQKAKQWADKAREMLGKLPPEQQATTAKRIAALDQKPGETQPGDRITSGVAKKKTTAIPGAEVKIMSEEAVAVATKQAEGGNGGAAYRLCRHYRALKDREKTVQWADKTRALLAEKPPENPQTTTRLLATLSQLEKEAGER